MCYHFGCAISLHSITNSGLIPGAQNSGRERQTAFFTAVNHINKDHKDPYKLDLTKPRLASYKQKKWKRHQDTVYWVDIQFVQRQGLKFNQTRCNAIVLYDTLPAFCISKVVMESGEFIFEKVYVSPRPPPTISFKDNWMKELDSEVAGSSKDTQRIQPKPKTQLSRTVRTVDGSKSIQSCVSMPVQIVDKYEDEDRTRTGRPVQVEEHDIDFRVPGLSHAVVKEAENFLVQELVGKTESHPHREALQADLQLSNVYNPFSNNSKEMIRELGNVDVFELCETIPKVQCSHCLLCWNQGIVHCTCGQFLVESESRRKFNKLRLDALSIPHYVIKKGRCRGARHGKTEEHKEYQKAWNVWKRCCKRVDSQGEHFKGIHDRFLRDQVYRESQLAIRWNEQKCIEMDELAKQYHTYHLSTEEFKRDQGQWYLTLNKSGKYALNRLPPDFRAAVSLKNRLHRESGEQVAEPISPQQNWRWHSSSSDSWWDTCDWSWWSSK